MIALLKQVMHVRFSGNTGERCRSAPIEIFAPMEK
jgi:hypothetical protein